MDTTIGSIGEKDDLACMEILKTALDIAKSGDLVTALTKLEECVEVGTSSFGLLSTIYMWLGRISNSLGFYEKTFSYYKYEVQVHRVYRDMAGATDAYLRLAAISVKLGKRKRARKYLEEFIEYALDENDCVASTTARLTLVELLLDEARLESPATPSLLEEAQKVLGDCEDFAIGAQLSLALRRLKAKYSAIADKNKSSAIEQYEKCIDEHIQNRNFEQVHKLYYEMAQICYQNEVLPQIDSLNNAIYYSKKCDNLKNATFYSVKLVNCFEFIGRYQGAYQMGLDVIKDVHNDGKLLHEVRMTICKSLIGIGKFEKAAYYSVLGSIAAVEKNNDENLRKLYELMDKMMVRLKNEEVTSVPVDSSDDPAQPIDDEQVVIKVEQTTTFEVWKMTITELIEAKKAKELLKLAKEEKKEEKELDLFDLIMLSNQNRMEDQRTVLPPSFAVPRASSRQSKTSETKKGKSFTLLPGLRLHKLSDLKIDKKRLNGFLKSKTKNKSKISLESDQESTCDLDTLGDLASVDSISLNKENMQHPNA